MRHRVSLAWREDGALWGNYKVYNGEGFGHMLIQILPGASFKGIAWDDIVAKMPAYLEWDEDGRFVGVFAFSDPREG